MSPSGQEREKKMKRFKLPRMPRGLPSFENTTLFVGVAVWLMACMVASAFVRVDLVFEVLDTLCFSAGVGFCIGFLRPFWHSIRLPPHKMEAAHLFTAGAWIISFAAAWVFAGQFYWRSHGKPDWIIDSHSILFSRALMAVGLVILMTTVFAKEGTIHPSGYWRSTVAVAAFVFVGTGIVFGFG
jgi:hypothetical protein